MIRYYSSKNPDQLMDIAGDPSAICRKMGLIAIDVPDPAPTIFSKLDIRRAMRRLGTEDKLNALLAMSPEFASDWADASEIDTADPVTALAMSEATIDIAATIAEIVRYGSN